MNHTEIQPQSLDKLSNESPPEDIFDRGASLPQNKIVIIVGKRWTVVKHFKLHDGNTYRLARRQMLRHVDVDAVYSDNGNEKSIEITYGYSGSYYTTRYEADNDTILVVYWE